MNPVRIIERKRDGEANSREEIQFVVDAAAGSGGMGEAQLAAWCMAVVLKGMSLDETAVLTQAIAASGETVNLSGLPKPWVDKHSTGGVGDKTTLVLLPMLAACGLTCVKMSGRGLGKTGGTIDKLESVPGFRTALSLEEMITQAREIGIALTSQTPRLTPADGTLYALRDVTGTVRSIPLIASSVLSKKIAGGADIISIDLKCGSGAFMESLPEAKELAATMIGVGQRLGLKLGIEITEMDQPLGRCVGNRLEVIEAAEVLQGAPGRLRELCLELARTALEMAGMDGGVATRALDSGAALSKAEQWFAVQGASVGLTEIAGLPGATCVHEVVAPATGWVERIDAGTVGEAAVDLGAGRRSKSDIVDPLVGIEVLAHVGDTVSVGDPIFRVHSANDFVPDLSAALSISSTPLAPLPLVLARMSV
ncbi:MAG: thymidine phosphorylase [Fimbriimonadaceae bacterium]|nr:thymidine phosphorylase [Fimbriimonadaceae bacterium]